MARSLIRAKSPFAMLRRMAILCCLPLMFWGFYVLGALIHIANLNLRNGKW